MDPNPWGALTQVILVSGLVAVPANLATRLVLRFKYPDAWKAIGGNSRLGVISRYQRFILAGRYWRVIDPWLLPLALVAHTALVAFFTSCTVFAIAILLLA